MSNIRLRGSLLIVCVCVCVYVCVRMHDASPFAIAETRRLLLRRLPTALRRVFQRRRHLRSCALLLLGGADELGHIRLRHAAAYNEEYRCCHFVGKARHGEQVEKKKW